MDRCEFINGLGAGLLLLPDYQAVVKDLKKKLKGLQKKYGDLNELSREMFTVL